MPDAIAVELYNAAGRSAVAEIKFLGGIQAATGINYGIGAFDAIGESERETLSLGLKPRLDFEWGLASSTLFSTFSAVAATTMLDGELSGQIVRSGDRAIDTDSTKIGWRNETLDFSIGGQDFAIGDGFVVGDGNFNKGPADGQYWIGAFTAWRNSAILRVNTKPVRADVFWLRSDDDLGDARIAGVNIETTTKDTFGTLGSMYVEIFDSNDDLALEGMRVASIRGADIKVRGIDNLKFFGEFVMERAESYLTGRANNANAYFIEGNDQFTAVSWTPKFFFRYSHFSGDEGDRSDSEEYLGLFYTIFQRDWDTWYQGEVTGEFHLFNQNQITKLAKVKVYLKPNWSLGMWYYNHELDTPQYFGTPVTDTDWAEEINVAVEYFPSDRLYTYVGFAWGTPHQGAIDAIGGRDDTFVIESLCPIPTVNPLGGSMATVDLIEYEDASDEVREIYDDIRALRKTDFINNFWQGLANNPDQLRRTWEGIKEVMSPGSLDPLTKELIYIAVSVANKCEYCIHSHTAAARAKGMTEEQYAELMSVIGMAHSTNGLVTTMQIQVDDAFKVGEG